MSHVAQQHVHNAATKTKAKTKKKKKKRKKKKKKQMKKKRQKNVRRTISVFQHANCRDPPTFDIIQPLIICTTSYSTMQYHTACYKF